MAKFKDWIESQQGLHFCQCGCVQEIIITKNQYYTGIIKYIQGHKRKHEIKQWVQQEQGKHFCKCGCGEEIIIKHLHYSRGIPKYINHHFSDEVKCKLKGRTPWNKGITGYKTKPCSKETKHKISESHMGLRPSEETLEKLRQSHIGYKHTEEQKLKISMSNTGKKMSEEAKNKIGEWHKGKKHTEESKLKMSNSAKGKIISAETRIKLSKCNSGENNSAWMGGISFEPYCPKFNNKLKERVRDEFDRKCVLCNKDEKENGKKLSIHHVTYEKMDGCNGNDFKLIPLCHSCHSKTNFNRDYWNKHFTEILELRESLN